MDIFPVPRLYLLALLPILLVISKFLKLYRSPLKKIPTVGHSGLLSYVTGFQWLFKSKDLIQEGYDKYYGRAFKVALPDRWMVVVSGPEKVEEIRRAADNELSFMEATGETLQTEHTMGRSIHVDPYHVAVVRGIMTRNLAAVFLDVRDEVVDACSDLIPVDKLQWRKVPAMETIMKIVCRTSNRLFVGLPLCRDPDYIALNTEFTVDAIKAATILNLFPSFLRPLAARVFTSVPGKIERGIRHLGPIIQHRLEQRDLHGKDWPGKPNDMLSWLIDEAHGERASIRELTLRILVLNFAAIHTTTMTFTSALFYLAANPQLAHPLREEVVSVIGEHGWSKASMDKLTKMDSFLKESQRLTGLGNLSLMRKALKDFSFSDGTVIPAGETVAVASYSTHLDDENYQNAKDFQGLRFEQMRDPNETSIKHQMVTPSSDYLLFGYGRHACPGRFFAVNELKIICSNILLNYDVKFEGEGKFPPPMWFGTALVPDRKAEVMFKTRNV